MPADPVAELLPRALRVLQQEFAGLPEFEAAGAPESGPASGAASSRMAEVLDQVAHRLGDNFPYFHPLYAGQMLKPPHPVARAAYALAMAINPNNHARDGGRASSAMELEAVGEIAAMFGWTDCLGHLTSGGTMANLEALWVAGELAEEQGTQGLGTERLGTKGLGTEGLGTKGLGTEGLGTKGVGTEGLGTEGLGTKGLGTRGLGTRRRRRVLASEQAHYTHGRISHVLKLEFGAVEADGRGRMRLDVLEDELKKGDVGTVVATLGTTAIGAVDPLEEILSLREKYGFRVHVDAAYGGYFRLIRNELGEETRRAFEAMAGADSIVVDPHKHGLQPYGCGCVLFRDSSVGRLYKHDSPYTYFTSKELHLGEISLECSRAGAAAVALWATQKLLPLNVGGEFARGLAMGRRAAVELDRRIRQEERFIGLAGGGPELDIVVWALAARRGGPAGSSAESSEMAKKVFAAAGTNDLHLALVQLPQFWFGSGGGLSGDGRGHVTCLRSVLMKPEHEAWLPAIWKKLNEACEQAGV